MPVPGSPWGNDKVTPFHSEMPQGPNSTVCTLKGWDSPQAECCAHCQPLAHLGTVTAAPPVQGHQGCRDTRRCSARRAPARAALPLETPSWDAAHVRPQQQESPSWMLSAEGARTCLLWRGCLGSVPTFCKRLLSLQGESLRGEEGELPVSHPFVLCPS